MRIGAATAIVALAMVTSACFSPKEPACAFSCAADGECPPSYTCGSDNLCHRADGQGVCTFEPVDASAE
jgi:hypothetical protein